MESKIEGLKVDLKPTDRKQDCRLCNHPIEKGQPRVSNITGAYLNTPHWSYYHLACFKKELSKSIGKI